MASRVFAVSGAFIGVDHQAVSQFENNIRSQRETQGTTRSRNEQVRSRSSNQRTQIIPLSTDSPRDIRAAATPTNPRAEGRDDRCCVFARNTYPSAVVFAHTGDCGQFQFRDRDGPVLDFQNVDWNSCSRETEEL